MQSLNNLPSDKVLKAWKEMLVFLQEFVENNFGKAALRRVVREPTYYEKLTNGGKYSVCMYVLCMYVCICSGCTIYFLLLTLLLHYYYSA